MAEVDWLHVADYAFYDKSGKVCLIGIFDTIRAQRVPAQHPLMSIALKVIGNPKERFKTRLEFKRPSGELLFDLKGEGVLGDVGGADLTLTANNVTLPDFGIYSLAAYINDRLSRSVSITVARTPMSP